MSDDRIDALLDRINELMLENETLRVLVDKLKDDLKIAKETGRFPS